MTEEQSINDEKQNDNSECAKIITEGGIKILYKGVWVTEIPFDREEITIGVMDPENDIYPDINLRQYRLDGGDPYISRKHARFYKAEDKFFIEDLCKNNSTSIGTKSNIINGESYELKDDTRIFISESITFIFNPDETKISQEEPEEDSEPDAPQEESAEDAPQEESAEDTPQEESAEDAPQEESAEDAPQEEKEDGKSFYLEVEGQVHLFFKPRNIFTHIIELHPKEWKKDSEGKRSLQIGRRSTEDIIYPDIDLWKFYFNDGDEYIARKHAQIYEEDGKLYFQDLSGKGSTWHNEKNDDHRLVRTDTDKAFVEIKAGDKLIISDSVTFIVHEQ